MRYIHFTLLLTLCLLFGCKSKKMLTAELPEASFDERLLDSVMVTAPRIIRTDEDYKLPTYNPSYTRVHDLTHTKLDLRFDWTKEQVIGKATLTLTPLFYPSQTLTLDAKNMVFNKVSLNGENNPLKYGYSNNQLTIELGKEFKAKEEYKIFIDYVASPAATGGSAAITSDQGLFFIDPKNEDPDKPSQIWTQGETEWNSKWFPTIDKPNERCTQEMYLTVDDKYKTLSNGLLKSSKKNPDGTRTDYWKMNQPHAPYLFMVAVGEFAVVKEKWRGKDVEYFVEKKYEKDAKAIFNHTREMLDFFSEKLGMEYPWDKYSQIVVRDYVSGAMENTTAVIYGEQVQRTARELLDENNDYIVAHEMFHHWFGDYVTCESWANLTMNEGFANYSEYLWFEHKYGAEEADLHRRSEMAGYLNQAVMKVHPLIHFGHDDKEDMFDSHSYNKGGMVLHMLRDLVGDDAFFAALNKYLKDNAYTAVEAHDLRLAFEDVTGKDWNWFFDQWYFSAGHPKLEISSSYDETTKTATVKVAQTQDVEKSIPIFRLPIGVDIYEADGKAVRHNIEMTKRIQSFIFECASRPTLIDFDADRVLLAEFEEEHTDEEFLVQYKNSKKFLARLEALEALKEKDSPAIQNAFATALDDPSWYIRMQATGKVNIASDASLKSKVLNLAKNDHRSYTRAAALRALAKAGDKSIIPDVKTLLDKEQSYTVIADAMKALFQLDPQQGLSYTKKLANDDNPTILVMVGEIYAQSGDPQYISFYEKKWNSLDGYDLIPFFDGYWQLLIRADQPTYESSLQKLNTISNNKKDSNWRRVSATKSLNEIRSVFKQGMEEDGVDANTKSILEKRVGDLTKLIDGIKAQTEDKWLMDIYEYYNY